MEISMEFPVSSLKKDIDNGFAIDDLILAHANFFQVRIVPALFTGFKNKQVQTGEKSAVCE